mgnify:CR=1 FL=1
MKEVESIGPGRYTMPGPFSYPKERPGFSSVANDASKHNTVDTLFSFLTGAAAFSVILLMAGILATLLWESWPAIEKFGLFRF